MGKIVGVGLICFCIGASAWSTEVASPWITAYYVGEKIGDPKALQPQNIDYGALTHIILFGAFPQSDGTLELKLNKIESPEAYDLVRRAHKAKVKVLLSLGSGFLREAVSEKSLPVLMRSLEEILNKMGIDGIDIDWEPIKLEEFDLYTNFIKKLRKLLGPKRLLTAAIIDLPELFNSLQDDFDQINLMTYDLAGKWLGMTWHNSALYGSVERGEILNSVDDEVKRFHSGGIKSNKIGVGLEFYGYGWINGKTEDGWPLIAPRQTWGDHPPKIDEGLSYTAIMKEFYALNFYHWDDAAQVPYLSIEDKDGDSHFISYENARSCRAKLSYVKNQALGGLMIWELGGDWSPHARVHEPLLESIKKASTTLRQSWQGTLKNDI